MDLGSMGYGYGACDPPQLLLGWDESWLFYSSITSLGCIRGDTSNQEKYAVTFITM